MTRVLRTFLLIFLLTIGLFACGKSKETCQRESADLAAMFNSMDTRGGVATHFVKLVRRDELPIAPDEFGVVLEVSAEGVRTSGTTDTPAEIPVVLDLLLQKWRGTEPPKLLLAIDADVQWRQLVNVFKSLENTGFDDVGLVFARKPIASTPPPRTPTDDKLDEAEKAEPSERAVQMAKVASELVRDCEAINTLFSSVSGGSDKAAMMIEGLPPALVECRCKCDVPALKSLMFRLLVNRAPTTSLHVRLDGAELALPEDAPWSEVAPQMTAGRAFKPKVLSR